MMQRADSFSDSFYSYTACCIWLIIRSDTYLQGVVEAMYLAGTHNVFEDTIRLEHHVFAGNDLYVFSDKGMNKGQFGQASVE